MAAHGRPVPFEGGIKDSDDKAAGGHRTEAKKQHYDNEVLVVKPPRRR